MIPAIILGAGGHARVCLDVLRLMGISILGFTGPDPNARLENLPWFGDDGELANYLPNKIQLVNGLGTVRPSLRRRMLFEQFSQAGFQFCELIHPQTVIANTVRKGAAIQVMAGAIIQPGCSIGSNCIINTKASVDHDCTIGDHVHIAPGAILSGGVEVGSGTHIGTGALVIQGITIGKDCLIAAGAVVTRDVPDGATVMGIPAKVVRI